MVMTMVMLTVTGCHNGPVYRPVDFLADSLVHDDIPKNTLETQEFLDSLEETPVITVPDIPQESDLLNEKNRIDVDKVMQEGF